MQHLNNEITDALTLADNFLQQPQEFVAILQRLNNQMWAFKTKMKGRVASHNANTKLRTSPTNQTSSTTSGTHLSPMDPSIK
jgi:hypothetical protein